MGQNFPGTESLATHTVQLRTQASIAQNLGTLGSGASPVSRKRHVWTQGKPSFSESSKGNVGTEQPCTPHTTCQLFLEGKAETKTGAAKAVNRLTSIPNRIRQNPFRGNLHHLEQNERQLHNNSQVSPVLGPKCPRPHKI